jgi:WD40 repeat protein
MLSPDGARVLTVQDDNSARLWDAATGEPLTEPLRQPGVLALQARFSPDGARVLTTCSLPQDPRDVGEVCVWTTVTGTRCGEPIRPVGDRPDPDPLHLLSQVGFSSDGERILTVLRDGACEIWDATTGRALTTPCKLAGPWSRNQTRVAASDGRRVLLAGTEETSAGRAQVWDATNGEALTRVLGHKKWITQAEFSPDGGRLLTASADGSARVWDAATGEALTPSLTHPGPVWQAQFSADGRRIFTSTARSPATYAFNAESWEVRVWDAATGQPLTPPLTIDQQLEGTADEGLRRWFSSDGHRVLLVRTNLFGGPAAFPQTLEVRELAEDARPVDELRTEIEVLSGRRIDPTGNVLPLDADRFRQSWQRWHTR